MALNETLNIALKNIIKDYNELHKKEAQTEKHKEDKKQKVEQAKKNIAASGKK